MPQDASASDTIPDLSAKRIFGVAGKICLVTGGGTGIGLMIATALVQNGAKVYIASRKLPALEETARKLSLLSPYVSDYTATPHCIALQSDLTTKAGCDALAEEIKKREKRLDVLVNNSGVAWGQELEKFDEKKGWDQVFALNVKAPFYLTVALVPLLEVGKDNLDPANVINISSLVAFHPVAEQKVAAPGTGTYSYNPSKAAIAHLTRTLAQTLSDHHINVNAIAPGYFPSRMTAYGLSNAEEELLEDQPTGRLGTPEDIAGAALFLSSRASSHIKGCNVVVDGGTVLYDSVKGRAMKAAL